MAIFQRNHIAHGGCRPGLQHRLNILALEHEPSSAVWPLQKAGLGDDGSGGGGALVYMPGCMELPECVCCFTSSKNPAGKMNAKTSFLPFDKIPLVESFLFICTPSRTLLKYRLMMQGCVLVLERTFVLEGLALAKLLHLGVSGFFCTCQL